MVGVVDIPKGCQAGSIPVVSDIIILLADECNLVGAVVRIIPKWLCHETLNGLL